MAFKNIQYFLGFSSWSTNGPHHGSHYMRSLHGILSRTTGGYISQLKTKPEGEFENQRLHMKQTNKRCFKVHSHLQHLGEVACDLLQKNLYLPWGNTHSGHITDIFWLHLGAPYPDSRRGKLVNSRQKTENITVTWKEINSTPDKTANARQHHREWFTEALTDGLRKNNSLKQKSKWQLEKRADKQFMLPKCSENWEKSLKQDNSTQRCFWPTNRQKRN